MCLILTHILPARAFPWPQIKNPYNFPHLFSEYYTCTFLLASFVFGCMWANFKDPDLASQQICKWAYLVTLRTGMPSSTQPWSSFWPPPSGKRTVSLNTTSYPSALDPFPPPSLGGGSFSVAGLQLTTSLENWDKIQIRAPYTCSFTCWFLYFQFGDASIDQLPDSPPIPLVNSCFFDKQMPSQRFL